MQKLNLGEGYNDLTAQPSTTAQPTTPLATPVSSFAPTRPQPLQKGSSVSRKSPLPLIIAALAIGAGVLTGMGAFKLQAKSGGTGVGGTKAPLQQIATGEVKAGDVFGVQDEKTFKDSAEGYLEEGGIEGEGTHKILRPGGDDQTVALTSTVTDLTKFEGMNVKVWGETYKGQKSGWLMDVGRVQIIDPQGSAPVED